MSECSNDNKKMEIESDYYKYNMSNGEFIIKILLKMIFPNHEFDKARPDWLVSDKTGSCLEIDLYNAELNLGIEYNGYHHYAEEVDKFHPNLTKSIIRTMENDIIKNRICEEKHFKLISVPFRLNWANIVNIKIFLSSELQKLGFVVRSDFITGRIPIPASYLSTDKNNLLREILDTSIKNRPSKHGGENSLSDLISTQEFDIIYDVEYEALQNQAKQVDGILSTGSVHKNEFDDYENDITLIDPDIIMQDLKLKDNASILKFAESLAIRNGIIVTENHTLKRENKKLKYVIDILNVERYKLISKMDALISEFRSSSISLGDISNTLNSK